MCDYYNGFSNISQFQQTLYHVMMFKMAMERTELRTLVYVSWMLHLRTTLYTR